MRPGAQSAPDGAGLTLGLRPGRFGAGAVHGVHARRHDADESARTATMVASRGGGRIAVERAGVIGRQRSVAGHQPLAEAARPAPARAESRAVGGGMAELQANFGPAARRPVIEALRPRGAVRVALTEAARGARASGHAVGLLVGAIDLTELAGWAEQPGAARRARGITPREGGPVVVTAAVRGAAIAAAVVARHEGNDSLRDGPSSDDDVGAAVSDGAAVAIDGGDVEGDGAFHAARKFHGKRLGRAGIRTRIRDTGVDGRHDGINHQAAGRVVEVLQRSRPLRHLDANRFDAG